MHLKSSLRRTNDEEEVFENVQWLFQNGAFNGAGVDLRGYVLTSQHA